MNYTRLVERPEPVVRFGRLETAFGFVDLPAVAPAPRTKAEALAILGCAKNGFPPAVISPLASRATATMPLLAPLLGSPLGAAVAVPRALIVNDPETEAFAFSASARSHFSNARKPSPPIQRLMETTLSTTNGAWKKMRQTVGFAGLLDYIFAAQERARSDVRFFPTSIVRASEASVDDAVENLEIMIRGTKPDPRFAMDGTQFLLHGEFFDTPGSARRARERFLSQSQRFRVSTAFANKVIGVKVFHNHLNTFHGSDSAHLTRTNISAFMMELAENVQAAGGLLVAHNWYNWSLGLLDSGADLVTTRLDGRMDIEVPMKRQGGPRGPQSPPKIYIPRSMVDYDEEKVRDIYERESSFPVAPGVSQEHFWSYKMPEKRRFAAQTRVAGFVELAREYREAGLDQEMLLAEAVRSRVQDSEISSTLRDLCASLRGP